MRKPGLLTAMLFLAGLTGAPNFLHSQAPNPHPFGLDDIAKLRSAAAIAVSPDGNTVLYVVSYYDATGPQKNEWHTINMSGDGDHKLTLPEHFNPLGFMPDGSALYGSYRVADVQSLAIVPKDSAKPVKIFSIGSGMQAPITSRLMASDSQCWRIRAPRTPSPRSGPSSRTIGRACTC